MQDLASTRPALLLSSNPAAANGCEYKYTSVLGRHLWLSLTRVLKYAYLQAYERICRGLCTTTMASSAGSPVDCDG